MLALSCVMIAAMPLVLLVGLLAWAEHRERRRREVEARQIALTDMIHERLGAVAAPLVRRHRGRWHVRIAVPFERPTLVERLLAIVRETFAPSDRRSLEIVLTRQPSPTKRAVERGVRRESLSWT